MKKNISRRKFLDYSGKMSLGLGLLSPFAKLMGGGLFKASGHSGPNDYKVLVCFFQSGGNDSFNMLMPLGAEYNAYAQTRSNLAIPEDEILPLQPSNTGTRQFGVHPSMPEIQALFNDGKLAFLSNTGTLIQPVTAEEVKNESAPLPLGLFSHVDQQQEWMTGKPHIRTIKGWGGKIADKLKDLNPSGSISMNISLAGTNIFQSGDDTVEFAIGDLDEFTGIYGYGAHNWDGFGQEITAGIDSMLNQKYNDPFKKTYIDVIKNAKNSLEVFNEAMENTPPLTTEFSDNDISNAFKTVAMIIKANNILGFKRQIFFIEYQGWDHHDELLDNHSQMLGVTSRAFGEFDRAMTELGMQDNVTVFSMSEFGRTLTSNGNGTDHAWGGNVMVMGGAVKGKKIYGDYPLLDLNNPLMLWDGVVVPTLSTDEYFTELVQWFGVSHDYIQSLFPNLTNFYDINSGQPPVGFMKS